MKNSKNWRNFGKSIFAKSIFVVIQSEIITETRSFHQIIILSFYANYIRLHFSNFIIFVFLIIRNKIIQYLFFDI